MSMAMSVSVSVRVVMQIWPSVPMSARTALGMVGPAV
jgi:hypothetical protein